MGAKFGGSLGHKKFVCLSINFEKPFHQLRKTGRFPIFAFPSTSSKNWPVSNTFFEKLAGFQHIFYSDSPGVEALSQSTYDEKPRKVTQNGFKTTKDQVTLLV